MTLAPPSFPHSAGRALSPTIEKRITLIERLLFKSELLSRLPVVARGINRRSVSLSGIARPSSGDGRRGVSFHGVGHRFHRTTGLPFRRSCDAPQNLAEAGAVPTASALLGRLYGSKRFQVSRKTEAPSEYLHIFKASSSVVRAVHHGGLWKCPKSFWGYV